MIEEYICFIGHYSLLNHLLRFYRKFDRLVQDEGGDNFITKLHQGKLDIISWPVIESAGFYKRFNNLKTRFMKQPVTHPQAGAFLVMLKTLMAKLKASVSFSSSVYR
jgi:hypothetical protein